MLKFSQLILFIFLYNSIFAQNGQNKSIVVLQDRKGIFLYDSKTLDNKQIYKATEFEIFLDEPIEILNDSQFVFGINGELSFFSDVNNKPYGEMYLKKYFLLNTKTTQTSLHKEIKYIVRAYDSLYVITTMFENKTKKPEVIERFKYTGAKSTAKSRIYYTTENNTFFKNDLYSNEVKGIKVAAFSGDLLLYTSTDTTLLAQSNEPFNSQLENGFSNPQISPNGKEVFCTLQSSNDKGKPINSLIKIDLKTKVQTVLLQGEFSDLKISKDGKTLLFLRNQKNTPFRTWQSDIYVLEINTLKTSKISKGYDAFWF